MPIDRTSGSTIPNWGIIWGKCSPACARAIPPRKGGVRDAKPDASIGIPRYLSSVNMGECRQPARPAPRSRAELTPRGWNSGIPEHGWSLSGRTAMQKLMSESEDLPRKPDSKPRLPSVNWKPTSERMSAKIESAGA